MTKAHWRWLGAATLLVAVGGAAAAWPASPAERVDITPERPSDARPGQGDCPAGGGAAGPEMTRLPGGFCIDRTEVTRGQYEAWLATAPSTEGQGSACAGNDDFAPSCAWPPNDNQTDQPVVCVDWCDAQAFCAAAGKRLCGAVGDGGSYDFDAYDDPEASEWHAACTSDGRYEYTYGDDIDRARCRGADAEDFTTWGLVDVASLEGCRSPDAPYDEVHDLSGNVAEWDNGCEGDEPGSPCRVRGGGFEHQHHGLRCAMGSNLRWPRLRRQGSIGFRCCAD